MTKLNHNHTKSILNVVNFCVLLSCAITLSLITHYITEINLSLSLSQSKHYDKVQLIRTIQSDEKYLKVTFTTISAVGGRVSGPQLS